MLEARRKQCSFIVTDERQRRRGRSARRLVPIWVLRATRRRWGGSISASADRRLQTRRSPGFCERMPRSHFAQVSLESEECRCPPAAHTGSLEQGSKVSSSPLRACLAAVGIVPERHPASLLRL